MSSCNSPITGSPFLNTSLVSTEGTAESVTVRVAVKVPGAHALNFSSPELIAELVEAHLAGSSLLDGPLAQRAAELVEIYDTAS